MTEIPTNCAQLLLRRVVLEADSPAASSSASNYLQEKVWMGDGDVEEYYDPR